MGQKTFDGIGRPLPNRTTIVLTQDPAWQFEGVHVAHDVPEALAIAQTLGSTLIVVGGGMVYRAMLPFTDELLLTLVDDDPEADTFFPEFEGDFQEIDHGEWVNTPDAPPFRFTRWVRTKEITSNT
jgi:dihydrofolate reductase